MTYSTLEELLEEHKCECCHGVGLFDIPDFVSLGNKVVGFNFVCPECKGFGYKLTSLPMYLLDHFNSTETSQDLSSTG